MKRSGNKWIMQQHAITASLFGLICYSALLIAKRLLSPPLEIFRPLTVGALSVLPALTAVLSIRLLICAFTTVIVIVLQCWWTLWFLPQYFKMYFLRLPGLCSPFKWAFGPFSTCAAFYFTRTVRNDSHTFCKYNGPN